MNITSYSLPIHLIRQYCFCPRIPYYQELLHINPLRPQWIQQGKQLHEQQQKVFKHRTLKRFNLEKAQQEFNVPVCSQKHNLHGIADSILKTDTNIYPIEFKLSGTKPMQGQILQLIAYGIALSEQYQLPCDRGFILYALKGKTSTIEFSHPLRQQAIKVKNSIMNDLEKSYLPTSSASQAQCTQCEYLNYCNDRS